MKDEGEWKDFSSFILLPSAFVDVRTPTSTPRAASARAVSFVQSPTPPCIGGNSPVMKRTRTLTFCQHDDLVAGFEGDRVRFVRVDDHAVRFRRVARIAFQPIAQRDLTA